MNIISKELLKIANQLNQQTFTNIVLNGIKNIQFNDDDQETDYIYDKLLKHSWSKIINKLKLLSKKYDLQQQISDHNIICHLGGWVMELSFIIDNEVRDQQYNLINCDCKLLVNFHDYNNTNIEFNSFEQFDSNIEKIFLDNFKTALGGFYKIKQTYSNYIFVQINVLTKYVIEQLKSKLNYLKNCDGVRSASITLITGKSGDYKINLKVGVEPKSHYYSTNDMIDACLLSIKDVLAQIGIYEEQY